MPPALTRAYMEWLPRLQAEEQVARINTIRMAMGDASTPEHQAASNRLAQAVKAPERPKQQTAPESLAALGFAVRRIPVRRVTKGVA